jgi:hypothetical protein
MSTTVTATGVRAEHVTVPLDPGRQDARLSFDNGLERLSLTAGAGELAAATFSDPLPVIWASGHNVHVEYPLGSRLLRRMKPSEVRLNPDVTWSVDVHGGAARLEADLREVATRAVSFHSGVTHLRLALGRPAGQCTIRFSSLMDVAIERPAEVPVRIELARGATRVRLDAKEFGAVGNGLADQTDGYDVAADRYLVLVSAGADGLSISGRGVRHDHADH